MFLRLRFLLVIPILFAGSLASKAVSPASPAISAPENPAIGPVSTPAVAAPEASSALPPVAITSDELPDAPQSQTTPAQPATAQPASASTSADGPSPKQTKRILFIIPNFRSVTADEKLPPTTTRQKFKLMLQDSFDYSAFAEVAILAGMGEAQTSEPEFHGGWPGYGRYYWHNLVDLDDGNLMTEFVFPVVAREDPRYYTLGHGGLPKRTYYAVSRLFITRNNQGNPTPNLAEIVGNGAAAGISSLYYPSAERDWTKVGQRWVLQVGIDGLSNIVKEFWPEVNRDLFHNKY